MFGTRSSIFSVIQNDVVYVYCGQGPKLVFDPIPRPDCNWLQFEHHLVQSQLYPKSNPQTSPATAMAMMTSSSTPTTTTTTSSSIFSFFASLFTSNPPPVKSASQPQRARDYSYSPPGSLAMTSRNESLYGDVSTAICPALANANVMFFRSAYNVQVIVDENEHEEKLLGRFRREVMRAGIIQECKRRKFFENRQEEKKRRTRDAAKRNKKRRPYRAPVVEGADATKVKKDDDDGDNWDIPEGL